MCLSNIITFDANVNYSINWIKPEFKLHMFYIKTNLTILCIAHNSVNLSENISTNLSIKISLK